MSEQDEQQAIAGRWASSASRERLEAVAEAVALKALQECECEPYGGTICRVCGAREILKEAGVTP